MNYMLTVEIDDKTEQVFIHGNPAGLRFLAKRLEAVATYAERDAHADDHLMTEAWGGHELSNEVQSQSALLINHLVIHGWHAKKSS